MLGSLFQTTVTSKIEKNNLKNSFLPTLIQKDKSETDSFFCEALGRYSNVLNYVCQPLHTNIGEL